MQLPRLAIVGSRRVSPYGRAVTLQLAGEAAKQGIVIVSGLAIGVDGLAHRAALEAGGATMAILPSGLDAVYPYSHRQLADDIVNQGGALITEYPPGTITYPSNFVARNRIVSAISDAVLITEATAKSGTIHTANFALDQGIPVLAVPGNITSKLSEGTNNLIKCGATPVTSLKDILNALNLAPIKQAALPLGDNPAETALLQLIHAGTSDGGALLGASQLDPAQFNQTLTMLELTGKVRPLGAGHWAIA